MDKIIHIIGVTMPLLLAPGANNLLLMNAGASNGFKNCLPHILGSVTGFLTLLLSCLVGLSGIINTNPLILEALQWIGAIWLLYLAWQFYATDNNNSLNSSDSKQIKPFTYIQAFTFMLTNPGALSLSLIVFSLSTQTTSWVTILTASLVGLIATITWTLNGRLLAPLFINPKSEGKLKIIFSLALIYSAFRLILQ